MIAKITIPAILLILMPKESGIVDSPWLWAVFGVLMYNYLVFNLAKDELDEAGKSMKLKDYAKNHWDNWIWSLFCVPVVVIFGDQLFYYLMEYFEKDWQFHSVIYLSAGALAEGLYYLLKKVAVIKRALSNKNKV